MAVTRIPGGGVGRNPFGVEWVGAKGPIDATETLEDPLFSRRRPKPAPLDAETEALLMRLHPYRRRLARLVGDAESDYDLTLAEGTIAMIDEQGLVYIGREFLVGYAADLEVQVGVLAHEIGHRPRRWKAYRAERRLTRAEIEELCRIEETRADYFAGYALGHLDLECEPLCDFLAAVEDAPHPEYFPAVLRAKTIREAHGSGVRRRANARKFFPEFARMTAAAGDLGTV